FSGIALLENSQRYYPSVARGNLLMPAVPCRWKSGVSTMHTSLKRYLRTAEAAAYIGSTKSTMEKRRLAGDGPPFIRIGRTICYDVMDLDRYCEANRYRSTSDPGRHA